MHASTTATTDLAALLAGPIAAHCFDMGASTLHEGTPEAFRFKNFNLGFGDILAGEIHGNDRARNTPGYPRLSIAEAEAVRAEIIRRWNAFPALLEALPFPAIQAGTADSLAFQLEKNGTFGTITPEAVSVWLRHLAKQLNALHAIAQAEASK